MGETRAIHARWFNDLRELSSSMETESIFRTEEMNSNNFAAQVRADEWSADGFGWHEIPPQINVLGHVTPCASRICTKRSLDYRFQQPALRWGIALVVVGSQYIRGRVDKACLEAIADQAESAEIESVQISLVAELVDPYAVFLRNKAS